MRAEQSLMTTYWSWGPYWCWLVHQWCGFKKTHLTLAFTVNHRQQEIKKAKTNKQLPVLLERLLQNQPWLLEITIKALTKVDIFILKACLISAFPWAILTTSWQSRHYDNEGHCCSQLQHHMGWPAHKADVDNLSTNIQGMGSTSLLRLNCLYLLLKHQPH